MGFRFSICDFRLNARRRRRGFSFTEVLFAIFILAIGFIMIAAMFPVAIRQTQSTAEETSAAVMSRGAVNAMQQIALTPPTGPPVAPVPLFPQTDLLDLTKPATFPPVPPNQTWSIGKAVSFRDNRLPAATRDAIWAAVKGSLILTSDPRYAWVGMYRRDGLFANPGGAGVQATGVAAYGQLIVIGVQSRARSIYEPARDLVRYPTDTAAAPTLATLEPMLMQKVTLSHPAAATASDTITFDATTMGGDAAKIAAGAVVVISDDKLPRAPMNGHVYRLGNPGAAANTWELSPPRSIDDAEIAPSGSLANLDVFVVGREYLDPKTPANGYDGNVQDIAVYTTFIRF